MIFEQLNQGTHCRTYLAGSGREALLVDPLLAFVDAYLARCDALGLRLKYVIDTHTHADHLSGLKELTRRTGAASLGAPEGVVQRVLREGDELQLGELTLKFWVMPGHTSDSLLILLPDRVLTGDSLFIGTTGRTDLPTGDAEQSWQSLQRMLALPDEMLVFPGHDYGGLRSYSTIGGEKRENARLRMEREPFLELMRRPRKDLPDLLAEALAYNTTP
jgi:sulfur dioxygenase